VTEIQRDGQLAAKRFGVGDRIVIRRAGHARIEGTVGEAEGAAQETALGVEAGFRDHVHGAADRIAVHVGRGGFDDLHALDGIGADGLKLILAGGAGGSGVGDAVAVHRDGREVLIQTADADVAHRAVDGHAFDARQADEQVGGILGEIAEGVGGNDVLHARGETLQGDGLGVALAFAGDDELAHGVDLRRHFDIESIGLAGAHGGGGGLRVETRVGNVERNRAVG